MTSMQRHTMVHSALLRDGDVFDMWHDYMNLGGLVQRLRERDTGPDEWPERHPPSRRQPSPTEDCRESGSVSSLSDASSGTSADYCRFCKHNGESARVYRSHKLKSDEGKVLCPILWSYTCPTCEATGDNAHTRKYCPQARRQEAKRMLPETRLW